MNLSDSWVTPVIAGVFNAVIVVAGGYDPALAFGWGAFVWGTGETLRRREEARNELHNWGGGE